MLFLVCIITFLMLCFVTLLFARYYPDSERPKYIVQTLQAAIAAIALIAAGFWYFFDRRTEPHAILDLEITAVMLGESYALIETKAIVENAGHTLLELERWDVRLSRVVPTNLCLDRIAALPFDAWPQTIWTPQPADQIPWDQQAGQDCVLSDPLPRIFPSSPGLYRATRGYMNDHELRFGREREFDGMPSLTHAIEPGERDLRIFDFIVECDLQVARIFVAVQETDMPWLSILRPQEENLWWKNQALISLEDVCSGEPGNHEILYRSQG